jgi:hypothetical protein
LASCPVIGNDHGSSAAGKVTVWPPVGLLVLVWHQIHIRTSSLTHRHD